MRTSLSTPEELETATLSLGQKLKAHDFTALTTGGEHWVRKALHPAEPTVKAPRIPSHGTRPTVTQETTMTFVMSPPADSTVPGTGLWDGVIILKNDPLCPLEIQTMWQGSSQSQHQTAINQAFYDGAPVALHTHDQYAQVVSDFRDSCEMYRTTALSVTATYVGATIQDQGSIISAQMADPTVDVLSWTNNTEARPQMWMTRAIAQAIPTSDTLILGTTPYVSNAKEGVYVPYKMDHPEVWHRSDEIRRMQRFLNPPSPSELEWNSDSVEMYPYPWGNYTGTRTFMPWLPPLDDGISVTWFRGVASSASYRIVLRISVEMMTRPESRFASFCEPPALPDDHAIAMYFEIVSRMKDAYPARDNANGSLWDKIKGIAKGVWKVASPALSMAGMGGLVDGINTVAKLAPGAGKLLTSIGRSKKPIANAADVNKAAERAEAATGNPIVVAQPSVPRGKGKKKRQRKRNRIPPPPPDGYEGVYDPSQK